MKLDKMGNQVTGELFGSSFRSNDLDEVTRKYDPALEKYIKNKEQSMLITNTI